MMVVAGRRSTEEATYPSRADQGSGGRAAFRVWYRAISAAVVILVLLLPMGLSAQIALPRPVGYVNDFAGVIPAEQVRAIEQVVEEVRARSGGEIVVVTLPSLEGRPITEVGLQIGREWGVGRAGDPGEPARNTGVVVLVVPSERQLRIEVGLGANPFLTAGEAGRIRDEYMLPAFRRNDFGEGILLGVTAIAHRYAETFGFELSGQVPALPGAGVGERPTVNWAALLFVAAIILVFLLSSRSGGGGGRGPPASRRRRSRFPVILPMPMGGRGRGGGFRGGGFGGGGFGGGGFGGGGFGGLGGGGGFGGGGVSGRW
jgi:uncharacterized protein